MTDTDAPETPDSKELARRLFVAAARFAGSALEDYKKTYPTEYAALLVGNFAFTVRIDGMLESAPRVSLVTLLQRIELENQMCSREVEVAHVSLSAPGPGALRH